MTSDPDGFRAAVGPRHFPQVPPYSTRFAAYLGAGVRVWRFLSADGRTVVGATGDPDTALALTLELAAAEFAAAELAAAELAAAGGTAAEGPVVRCSLPRMPHEPILAALPGVTPGDWEMRWSVADPPACPGEERLAVLHPEEYAQIDAVLDAALPDAHTRPGSSRAVTWYGIRDGADVLAVAADASAYGVGQINSIAVRPDAQGRGLGGALTAALTRRLRAANTVVQLGVADHNAGARRLYQRLGYTEEHRMTSFTIRPHPVPA